MRIVVDIIRVHTTLKHSRFVFYHNLKGNGKNHRLGVESECRHYIKYANELLVRVRLSCQKLLQTRSTCRNNAKKTWRALHFDLFLFYHNINVKENNFSTRELNWSEQRVMDSYRESREILTPFKDWSLLIDTVQYLWRSDVVWYPINSAEWHLVVFCLPASNFLQKALHL